MKKFLLFAAFLITSVAFGKVVKETKQDEPIIFDTNDGGTQGEVGRITAGGELQIKSTKSNYSTSGYIGTPGAKAGLGELALSRFPAGAQSTSELSFYNLFDATDEYGSRDLTNTNVVFDAPGLWRGNVSPYRVARFDGTSAYFSSSNAFFNPGNSKSMAFGGWFYVMPTTTGQTFVANGSSNSDWVYYLGWGTSGYYTCQGTNSAGSIDTSVNVTVGDITNEWHHVVCSFDHANTTLKLYVDGVLVRSGSLANIRSATSNTFRVGSLFTTNIQKFYGYSQDVFFYNAGASSTDLTDAEIETIYGSTTPNQINSGHVIDRNTFSQNIPNSQLVWWNLATDANDDSGNGYNLTNNNTIPFTGSNIFGDVNTSSVLDGVNQYFSNTNSFFNVGPGMSFSYGCRIRPADFTPTGYSMLGFQSSSSDRGYVLDFYQNNIRNFVTNTATVHDASILYNVEKYLDGSWHDVVSVFDYPGQQLRLYFDGRLVGSSYATNQRTVTSAELQIGANQSSVFFKGNISDCFFIKGYVPTEKDIKKFSSIKVSHNKNISSDRQDWKVTIKKPNGVNYDLLDAIVDKSGSNDVYVNFGETNIATDIPLTLFIPTFTATVTDPSWVSGGTLQGLITKRGKMAFIEYRIRFGATANQGSGIYKFGLPDGLHVDKAYLGTTADTYLGGGGFMFDNSAGTSKSIHGKYDATNDYIYAVTDDAGGAIGNNVPVAWTSSDTIQFNIEVPIKEWEVVDYDISHVNQVFLKLFEIGE